MGYILLTSVLAIAFSKLSTAGYVWNFEARDSFIEQAFRF